jgi:hypothetical protein
MFLQLLFDYVCDHSWFVVMEMLHNWPFPEWKETVVCVCVCVLSTDQD